MGVGELRGEATIVGLGLEEVPTSDRGRGKSLLTITR
jgi:hypothetical protein